METTLLWLVDWIGLLPGKVKSIEETDIVRLKSKMNHTRGSDTLDRALNQLK